ncbi:hypothetical protein GCWU000246_01501 [Jonquetella anthropi E3_33 E1]|nr:hypothetical protein GCWU000246_01501 [Jonquetella anthropi E3_33 E1]
MGNWSPVGSSISRRAVSFLGENETKQSAPLNAGRSAFVF